MFVCCDAGGRSRVGEWGHTQGLAHAKQVLYYIPSPSMMVVSLCSEALQWIIQFCEAVTALVPYCSLSLLRFFPELQWLGKPYSSLTFCQGLPFGYFLCPSDSCTFPYCPKQHSAFSAKGTVSGSSEPTQLKALAQPLSPVPRTW